MKLANSLHFLSYEYYLKEVFSLASSNDRYDFTISVNRSQWVRIKRDILSNSEKNDGANHKIFLRISHTIL